MNTSKSCLEKRKFPKQDLFKKSIKKETSKNVGIESSGDTTMIRELLKECCVEIPTKNGGSFCGEIQWGGGNSDALNFIVVCETKEGKQKLKNLLEDREGIKRIVKTEVKTHLELLQKEMCRKEQYPDDSCKLTESQFEKLVALLSDGVLYVLACYPKKLEYYKSFEIAFYALWPLGLKSLKILDLETAVRILKMEESKKQKLEEESYNISYVSQEKVRYIVDQQFATKKCGVTSRNQIK